MNGYTSKTDSGHYCCYLCKCCTCLNCFERCGHDNCIDCGRHDHQPPLLHKDKECDNYEYDTFFDKGKEESEKDFWKEVENVKLHRDDLAVEMAS